MPKNTTSDLALLRAGTHEFTWGMIGKIHDIGRYSIVEYHAYMDKAHSIATSSAMEVEIESSFHVYVDGVDCSRHCNTLEQALVTAIAYGVKAPQGIALAACRVLGISR